MPQNPLTVFVTLTMTYFMTGGMYWLVEDRIKEGLWMLHIVMVTYLFVSTIMLNILLSMINHAFGNEDHVSELTWVRDRMIFVARAENTLRSLPFFRSKHDWFPDKIYYTATAQQIRDYREKSRQILKKAAEEALPLRHDLLDDDYGKEKDGEYEDWDEEESEKVRKRKESFLESAEAKFKNKKTICDSHGTSNTIVTNNDISESQQDWIEQLKLDLSTEFREQMAAQRRQSDQQIAQLQTQLSEILTILKTIHKSE
ncbi:hypothetical protein FBU30_003740 [Linnemannia zychae]|nr:hypothetical protein FBU30_003740 [Linnemannia zychae]